MQLHAFRKYTSFIRWQHLIYTISNPTAPRASRRPRQRVQRRVRARHALGVLERGALGAKVSCVAGDGGPRGAGGGGVVARLVGAGRTHEAGGAGVVVPGQAQARRRPVGVGTRRGGCVVAHGDRRAEGAVGVGRSGACDSLVSDAARDHGARGADGGARRGDEVDGGLARRAGGVAVVGHVGARGTQNAGVIGRRVGPWRALGAYRRAGEAREARGAGLARGVTDDVCVRPSDACGAHGETGSGSVGARSTRDARGYPGGGRIGSGRAKRTSRRTLKRNIRAGGTRSARCGPGGLSVVSYGTEGTRRQLLRACVGAHGTGGTRRHAAARGVGAGNTWEVPGQ